MIQKYKHHFIAGFIVICVTFLVVSITIFKFPVLFADLLSVDENPACPTNLQAGDLIKVTNFDNNIFTIDSQDNLLYYPSLSVLKTWILNPANFIYVNSSCLDSLSLQVPEKNSGVTYHSGVAVFKHTMGSQLYVIYPGRKLVPISPEVAKYLYGNSTGTYSVVNIAPAYWASYTVDRDTSVSAVGTGDNLVVQPYPGMLVKINGIIYYVYTDGKLREVTTNGFTANNFQTRFVRTLSSASVAGMQYGSIINSEIKAITDQTQLTAYPVDTGTSQLPPVAPTLSATTTARSVSLSWTAYNESNFKYYRLVRSETNTTPVYPGDLVRFTGTNSTQTSFIDTSVTKDKTYYYSLCIQSTVNTYLCSKSVKVTVQDTVVTPPAPVASVLTGSANVNGVVLSWSAYNGDYFKAYHVVRSTTDTTPKYPDASSLTDITSTSTTTYTDNSTAEGTTYYYSICTEDTYNQVTCSISVNVTTQTTTPPPNSSGTTYYIRTDGGTYEQCNGKSDVAYSASITDKKCAVNHPFQLFPPSGTARIAGGDTVIIANGSYMMGFGASGATACSEWYPWDCTMPAIPSGPSKSQPTKILGSGYNSGCTVKPQLWGTERAHQIFNLNGSSNIDMECLEVTDQSECVEFHSGSIACNRDSYPFGKWAQTGIYAADSANVTMKNLDIHGLAGKGIWVGRLTDWTVESTKIEGNGTVGWDGDMFDGSDANSGTMTFKKVNIDWNGCGQTYPGRQPIGCWGQSAGGYGDGLGTGATGGDWIFEDSTFLHNTSDGLDMLYHRNGGKITIRRVHAEGNAGNQLKTSGNAEITDSVIVGNCGYFQNKSFTHNVDPCRALGNAVSIDMTGSTSPTLFYNNSVYSEGDGLVLASGAGSVKLRNNALYAGTDYHQSFETSFYLYSEGGTTFDHDYNIVYNAKNNGGVCAEKSDTHNLCNVNPLFTSVNSNSFDLKLQSTSPAIDKGTNETGITSTDFLNRRRPQGEKPDMGAYEIK